MKSDCDSLRVYLEDFLRLCAKRRDGLAPDMEESIQSILLELDDDEPPALSTLLSFETAFNRLGVRDPHLAYLHGVLKGYRERTYRSTTGASTDTSSKS